MREGATVYEDRTGAEAVLAGHAHRALCQSVVDAFATMAGMEVRIELRPVSAAAPARRVVAVIGLVGRYRGTGVFECAPEFACLLASRMLGLDAMPFNEDALDVAAEMANIIFGGMKTELEHWLGPMRLGTPTVLYGSEVSVAGPVADSGKIFTVVPVAIEEYALRVKLHLAPAEEATGMSTQRWSAERPAAAAALERER